MNFNTFPKEELLKEYYPSELILVKEKGKYRFAVHYYPGIPAVKILHNNKDLLNSDVEFANFVMTDPNNLCPLSHGDKTTPFKTHFVRDIAFGVPCTQPNRKTNLELSGVIASVCDEMMDHQRYANNDGTSAKMPTHLILAYEQYLNVRLKKFHQKMNNFEK